MTIRFVERATGRWACVALLLLVSTTLLPGCGGGSGTSGTDASPGSGSPPPATQGKVTLNWARPTSNEDGSILNDLAGYKVYYGQTSYALDSVVDVHGSSLTSVEIGGLASGTWYFAIASYNSSGVESMKSGVVSTTL